MNSTATAMTAELRDELAANNRSLRIDTRSKPLRFFHMKAMGQSASHCLAAFDDDRKATSSIGIGKGTHALLLKQPVLEYPGKVRRGKEWDAFRSLNSHATILSSTEMAVSRKVVASIMANPTAVALLFDPAVVYEQSLAWEQNGRKRQSTPDARHPDYIVELKTTRCSKPERFTRDAMYRGYHAQVADQMAAAEAVTGKRPSAAYIIAVENAAPYPVSVMKLTDRALAQGDKLCRLWFEQFIECERSNAWPGYCESVTDFDVPDDEIDLVFGDDSEHSGEEP